MVECGIACDKGENFIAIVLNELLKVLMLFVKQNVFFAGPTNLKSKDSKLQTKLSLEETK